MDLPKDSGRRCAKAARMNRKRPEKIGSGASGGKKQAAGGLPSDTDLFQPLHLLICRTRRGEKRRLEEEGLGQAASGRSGLRRQGNSGGIGKRAMPFRRSRQGQGVLRLQGTWQETWSEVLFSASPPADVQRRTNENTNGLLREYFPKDEDIGGWTNEEINDRIKELNLRPRKRLG